MRKCKEATLLIEQDGRIRKVAKVSFGRGEFFIIPEQSAGNVSCGSWSFGAGETEATLDLAASRPAGARGFHLSFHRDGRVHAREGATEYARTDACPLDQLPLAAHVATIEVASIKRLACLDRQVRKRRSARQDWVFRCPSGMDRGHFPLFVSNDLRLLPEHNLNRFKVEGGVRSLYVGLRLVGRVGAWGDTGGDLFVLGGWDVRNQDPEHPDEFVWVSVKRHA